MNNTDSAKLPIRTGDIDGLGVVYSEFGGPILHPGETELRRCENCELAVYGSWRLILPKRIFDSLPGHPSGVLHFTNVRVIFLRKIDVWKEVKPLLTPLGLPTAAQKESKLKRLKDRRALQYCEIFPSLLELKYAKSKIGLSHFRLTSITGGKYEIFVRTEAKEAEFLDFLEATMRQGSRED